MSFSSKFNQKKLENENHVGSKFKLMIPDSVDWRSDMVPNADPPSLELLVGAQLIERSVRSWSAMS